MSFYIEVKNGYPINNPAVESNLIAAFGLVPDNWELCDVHDRPAPSIYKVISDTPTYEKINITWVMRWPVRDMTAEEKVAAKIAAVNAFNKRNEGQQLSNWDAWVFDEETCRMTAPFPRPASLANKVVFWCGADANWKEAPVRPEGNYKFDFFAWDWVAV
jgi:hypothetical protein